MVLREQIIRMCMQAKVQCWRHASCTSIITSSLHSLEMNVTLGHTLIVSFIQHSKYFKYGKSSMATGRSASEPKVLKISSSTFAMKLGWRASMYRV